MDGGVAYRSNEKSARNHRDRDQMNEPRQHSRLDRRTVVSNMPPPVGGSSIVKEAMMGELTATAMVAEAKGRIENLTPEEVAKEIEGERADGRHT